jgi:hypothetical protein
MSNEESLYPLTLIDLPNFDDQNPNHLSKLARNYADEKLLFFLNGMGYKELVMKNHSRFKSCIFKIEILNFPLSIERT